MSTNSPSNFMCTTLSSWNDACRYNPGTSKVCTALPSWVLINNDTRRSSNAMVGDVDSSRTIYVRWRIPSAHALPVILPHRFSLIRLTYLSALKFSWRNIIVAYWGPKTSRLFNFLYSFNMTTTDLFSYVLIPFFAPISVKQVSTVVLQYLSAHISTLGSLISKNCVPVLVSCSFPP